MKVTKCAIALGSNLGDSLAILKSAIHTLNSQPEISVKSHSSWYQTVPIGPPQPDYINACAILEVALAPEALLAQLLETETKFNRIRREKWGPRTLDLDLLFYDNLILETPTLTLPHPRIAERAFVLVPLAEIAPDWVHPVTGSAIDRLLQAVDCSGVQKLTVGKEF
jgi:2-amino-4-hydroxy-6-hydroxymethyldihydropteridine diphosphokinase